MHGAPSNRRSTNTPCWSFPGQHLTDAEQMAFGTRFGELSIESLPFSNRRDDGTLRDGKDPLMRLFQGNEGWHTDSSFQPVSAKASILSAREVPSSGGETEWADMRAAYDALDAETRVGIADLSAYHSLYHSQSAIGEGTDTTVNGLAELHAGDRKPSAAATTGYRAEADPPLRPLVKTHPVTGRQALYIGRHALRHTGPVGRRFGTAAARTGRLRLPTAAGPLPPLAARRRRDLGQNRCVLHRARPWDLGEARVMHHTRVDGDPATEGAHRDAPPGAGGTPSDQAGVSKPCSLAGCPACLSTMAISRGSR